MLEIDATEKAALSAIPTDRIGYHVDPEMSDSDWMRAIGELDCALEPGGICVLDVADLSRALHSEAFESLEQRWPERFARLSGGGFSFYGATAPHISLQKARQNVLYLAPWVSYGGSDKGTIDWFRCLDKERFRPFLITTQSSDNALLARIEPYAKEIWSLPDFMQGGAMPQFIMDFIASRNIHVLHIMNSRLAYDLLPTLRSYYPWLRVVIQFHVEEEDRSGYCRYVATRYDNLINAYSVTSKNLRRALLDYEISPNKLSVIYTGIDADEEFNPETVALPPDFLADAQLDQPGFHILYPSRLEEQKDPLLMVEVAAALKQAGSRAVIHVVGDGTLRPRVADAIAEKDVAERVLLHGASRQMPQWYKETAATLLTSRFEGLPYVIYEAMAMERPVIVSNVGANAELVDASTGFLIEDRRSVGAYVRAILALENDPALLAAMGAAARRHLSSAFSLEQMAREHEALYHHLAGAYCTQTALSMYRSLARKAPV
ncbi:MAG: glycosyltransferase family 4 protein [Thermomicrobiales bacterium]